MRTRIAVRCFALLSVCLLSAPLAQLTAQEESSKPKPKSAAEEAQTAPWLSREEIRHRLNLPMTAQFLETPLKDVVSFMSDFAEVPIIIDTKSLEEMAISLDTPIIISVKNLRSATVIRMVLQQLSEELDFVQKEGFLLIGPKTKLDRQLEPRIYLARDLPGVTADEPDVEPILDILTTTIEPDSWEDAGGPARIVHHKTVIVILQKPTVHDKIADFLHEMQEAIDAPVGANQAAGDNRGGGGIF